MGRPSKGWRIRKRPGRPYSVSWTLDGTRTELGLGTQSRAEAERAAREAYALAVQGIVNRKRVINRARSGSAPTRELGQQWLAESSGTLRPRTRRLYAAHLRQLSDVFESLFDVTAESVEAYQRDRLSDVLRQTVKKELITLRGLLRYAHSIGKLPAVPEVRFTVKGRGTPFGRRCRVAADELSPEEVEKLLILLPEWSCSSAPGSEPFPVRSRFVVAYETGLRPSLLDILETPTHYVRGATHLRIPAEHDKAAQGRVVPLTPVARKALDSVLPERGIIFGAHDYTIPLRRAAVRALPPDKAKRFAGAHLRSARITHLLELTGNLPGVQRLVGHTNLGTTSRYLRASDRAAEAVVLAASIADQRRGQEKKSRG